MFDHCMYFNTSALARRLEREWALAFKPFDLAPPQAFMLRAVLKAPGTLQFELANTLAISRPTATRALDGLAAKKMITRLPTDGDGRHMAVYPTAGAIAIATGLNDASAKVTKRLKKLLGEAAFVDMVEEIRVVRAALK
jgi:MarR family transcriptional regulator, temperature-dependent positive regulator of motility